MLFKTIGLLCLGTLMEVTGVFSEESVGHAARQFGLPIVKHEKRSFQNTTTQIVGVVTTSILPSPSRQEKSSMGEESTIILPIVESTSVLTLVQFSSSRSISDRSPSPTHISPASLSLSSVGTTSTIVQSPSERVSSSLATQIFTTSALPLSSSSFAISIPLSLVSSSSLSSTILSSHQAQSSANVPTPVQSIPTAPWSLSSSLASSSQVSATWIIPAPYVSISVVSSQLSPQFLSSSQSSSMATISSVVANPTRVSPSTSSNRLSSTTSPSSTIPSDFSQLPWISSVSRWFPSSSTSQPSITNQQLTFEISAATVSTSTVSTSTVSTSTSSASNITPSSLIVRHSSAIPTSETTSGSKQIASQAQNPASANSPSLSSYTGISNASQWSATGSFVIPLTIETTQSTVHSRATAGPERSSIGLNTTMASVAPAVSKSQLIQSMTTTSSRVQSQSTLVVSTFLTLLFRNGTMTSSAALSSYTVSVRRSTYVSPSSSMAHLSWSNSSTTITAPSVSASGVLNKPQSSNSLQAGTNDTIQYFPANITASGSMHAETGVITSETSSSWASTSSVVSGIPEQRHSDVVAATFKPTSSPSQTVAAGPTPPLTTSQTAGVAIAGTTGLLLAVIAAVYIVRRHHADKARRSSTGSIYPKIAYLYDPVTGGPGKDDDDDFKETFMSGGSSGLPPRDHASMRAPPPPPIQAEGYRYSTASIPIRFSDPGNPFRDSEDQDRYSQVHNVETLLAPPNAAAALSDAITGYVPASQRSPRYSAAPILDCAAERASIVSPVISEAASPTRSSILGEIASMAYNPRTFQHSNIGRHPLSPYGSFPTRSLPSLREAQYTSKSPNPFEHDLLLQVDNCTETSHSVTVYAPPVTPQTSYGPFSSSDSKVSDGSLSVLDPFLDEDRMTSGESCLGTRTNTPDSMDTGTLNGTMPPNADILEDYDVTQRARPSTNASVSPIVQCSTPTYRGWDDIKRYSDDKIVPPMLTSSSLINLSPPPPSFKPAQYTIKKTSLPQLRRKEPALAGTGLAITTNSRLSLTVKNPFAHKRASKSEGHEAKTRDDNRAKTPDLSSMMHKKKSGTFDFAYAGV